VLASNNLLTKGGKAMKEQKDNNQDRNNHQTKELADLEAPRAEEIKGGPKKIFIGGLSVTEQQTTLPDLEPTGDVKGGPGSGAGGVWMNHNETIATDEAEEPATTAPLADLPVSDEQAEQTKGGLPAVQACREAARRMSS
jgi:hypothetical protein